MGKPSVEKVQVLIVGAGLAGLTAAIWCKRLGLHAVVVEQNTQIGGQLLQIKNEIWDFPPHIYDNGKALLNALLQNPKVADLDCRLSERLHSIEETTHRIETDKNSYQADYVILCTGVRPNSLPFLRHSGMVLAPWFSTTSQGDLLHDKQVLIIGGGDRAMESGYNLAAYARHIWVVVRSDRLRARPEWVKRLSACDNVTVRMNTEVVRTSEAQEPKGVYLRQTGDSREQFLAVDWILPRIGVRGNSDPVSFLKRCSENFIEVDSCQLTSTDWIYAIGDVTNGAAYASLALAAGQAMRAAKHISIRKMEG
ncbi:NAD(P)/FAD-dependent oxidoreductase [Brevibacillus humidisoli]|uniref:NAD(P)/FAD-dependent oxidoreductase n=1 Tax=Brevibacillus humidisoli TaxID=2895522 RepID=UPI001E29DF11|nr:NAD(P)/FAD-dependent oxidoreductase [Brevibacillus humidisoli]UFJ41948.1 NAD(P)/FAD-dependent oxidoreductase [Brevibacillus humidisoli]